MSDISTQITHDLWVEARQFTIDIDRLPSNQLKLTVTRPTGLKVTDGCIILLSTKAINATNYPQDGTQYTGSTDWTSPASTINGAQVVSTFYGILDQDFPADEDSSSTTEQFSVIITNVDSQGIYYASVHATSNVLQYYPLGVQSYPLDSNNVEKNNATFTGNIPSLPSAPTSPHTGMVYYDQQLNSVQYWTGTTWIPTRSDSIVSGPYNPGILGQVYLLSSGTLKAFDGFKWVDITSQNFQVRTGMTSWSPFASVRSDTSVPDTANPGEFVYDYSLQRIQFWGDNSWIFPDSTNTLFNNGTTWVPAFVLPITVEPTMLANPYIGQLFYNTTSKVLNAWDGEQWTQANTDQQGTPTSSKIAIGTDGSYDERIQLVKVVKSQLGWPQFCVELSEDQFNFAIDDALDTYRQLSAGAYTNKYVLFKLIPEQQTYYLNSAVNKTDRIVDIHKIHRMGPIGPAGLGGPNDIWYQAFTQQFYNLTGGGADILSSSLYHAWGDEINRLFAGDIAFNWDENSRELVLFRKVIGYENVVIECFMEKTEQELINDRWAKQFIQNWTMAELKMTLGLIRSKYSSGTPGASGTITLNGELLIAEARQDMTELKQSLLDYEYGGHVGQGNVSFLLG